MENEVLDMKNRKQETKAGSTPTANPFMNPARGYDYDELKKKLKEIQ